MTNPVTNAAAPSVKDNYGGYPVVKDERGQYSLESPRFFYRNSTLASAQAELNNDVKAVEEFNKKQAAKPADEKTATWKLVVFFPFYLGKFVLGTVASLFSKCCALFGYGKKVEEAAKTEQKPAVAPTAAK